MAACHGPTRMVDDRRRRATRRARTWPVEACGNRRTRRVGNDVPGSARGRMVGEYGGGCKGSGESRPAGNCTRREGRLVAVAWTPQDRLVGIACRSRRYRYRSSRRLASGGMTSHPGTMALGVHCRRQETTPGMYGHARPTRAAVAREVACTDQGRTPRRGTRLTCRRVSRRTQLLGADVSIATASGRLGSSTRARMAGKGTSAGLAPHWRGGNPDVKSRGRSGLDAGRAGSARRDAGQAIERNRSR